MIELILHIYPADSSHNILSLADKPACHECHGIHLHSSLKSIDEQNGFRNILPHCFTLALGKSNYDSLSLSMGSKTAQLCE